MSGVVILGAGQGGSQAAAALRTEKYAGPVILVGDEPEIPYQRPPLSKAYLLGKQTREGLMLRPESFYREQTIETRFGVAATAIDRAARTVSLSDGTALSYDHLILATGTRNRALPVEGADLDGVIGIRTLADADDLKARIDTVTNAVVIGGGFIGLEFAAAARTLGRAVTVIEAQPRLMARALPPTLSAFFLDLHRARGVDVLLETGVLRILGEAGRVTGVETTDGRVLPADLVVVGIGVIPNTELAAAAGLKVENGIVVDRFLATEDPAIFALGDVANFPVPHGGGARQRLESVQNAVDQARTIAAAIAGRSEPYVAVPWFWSDQYEIKLQMVGLSAGADLVVPRGDAGSGRFSLCSFRDGRLIGIDSVNRPADHMAGRRLLAYGRSPTPEQAEDLTFDFKTLL